MGLPLIAALCVLLVAILGLVLVWVLWRRSRSAALGLVANAEKQARRVLARAEIDGERLRKDVEIVARERLLAARTEFERETRDQRLELFGLETTLEEKGTEIDRRSSEVVEREQAVAKLEDELRAQQTTLGVRSEELESALAEERVKLEQIAGLTTEQAKQELLKSLENEARMDAANLVRKIEEESTEKAKERARRVISMAIQRIASEHVVESTVSVVDLPSDEMKGRIIGREGRNIRALEAATGVDLIIDDTPEAVILSGFNPVRREVARLSLMRLISDGRIHPARIEDVVKKVGQEVDIAVKEAGEQAVFDLGVHGIHNELIKTIGRLKFRTSYAQNALQHSIEVGFLSGIMASELGLNAKMARRMGVLHDIGKAIDHEVEGPHALIGSSLAKKFNESPKVVHAIAAHHEDVPPNSVLALLVQAADGLSGARPGARKELLENYIKRLEDLENIANSFKGVSNTYAIQAGRELRVIVESEMISDEEATLVSRDIAKKIEESLTFPGQIKVTVIRETRAVEYANK